MSNNLPNAKFEGVRRVILSEAQIEKIANEVSEKGVIALSKELGCSTGVIRTAISSLRKAGLEVKLPPRRVRESRYASVVARIQEKIV